MSASEYVSADEQVVLDVSGGLYVKPFIEGAQVSINISDYVFSLI
jgi:hypothetical protein